MCIRFRLTCKRNTDILLTLDARLSIAIITAKSISTKSSLAIYVNKSIRRKPRPTEYLASPKGEKSNQTTTKYDDHDDQEDFTFRGILGQENLNSEFKWFGEKTANLNCIFWFPDGRENKIFNGKKRQI